MCDLPILKFVPGSGIDCRKTGQLERSLHRDRCRISIGRRLQDCLGACAELRLVEKHILTLWLMVRTFDGIEVIVGISNASAIAQRVPLSPWKIVYRILK